MFFLLGFVLGVLLYVYLIAPRIKSYFQDEP